jgi:hypothetical protein
MSSSDVSSSEVTRSKFGAAIILVWGGLSYLQWATQWRYEYGSGSQLLWSTYGGTDFIRALRPRAFFAAGPAGVGVFGGVENLVIGKIVNFFNFSWPREIAPLALVTLLVAVVAGLSLLSNPPIKKEHLRAIAAAGALLHPVLYVIQAFPLWDWYNDSLDLARVAYFVPALILTSALPIAGAVLIAPSSILKRVRRATNN